MNLKQEDTTVRAVHVLAICTMTLAGTIANAQEIDWKKVDEALGRTAVVVSGDVRRYGFARSDLQVTLDGVTIRPALALGGWVAFKPAHGGAMIMGDLVLLETEINPVMLLIDNGQVTDPQPRSAEIARSTCTSAAWRSFATASYCLVKASAAAAPATRLPVRD
jgi:hypothetical protein